MEEAKAKQQSQAETETAEAASPIKLRTGTADAAASPHGTESALEFVLDIPLRVSVELGRTKILVQDLLKLHKGSVIELSKIAGEPLEILVNEQVVAKGEVIVVNEKFGVRLTDIVSHAQRIRQLGE